MSVITSAKTLVNSLLQLSKINQLKNYEDGQVPSESNGKMLRIVSNPLTMMALLEISRNEFQESEYDRVKGKIALNYFEQNRKLGII